MVVGTRDHERRERLRAPRAGRHRGVGGAESFSGGFTALAQLAYAGATVSASVIDLRSGLTLVSIDDRVAMPTASVGKILLLIEVAARITARDAAGFGILDKTPGDAVGDSGIWQRLQAPALPVTDLALLVGATSDNLATNVLLRQVGLDSVRARGEQLGLSRTALLDLVRDHRGPDDAPQLSIGSAAELSWLFSALARGEVVDAVTSKRVLGWLSHNADLSMVASAFGLDPLSHRTPDSGLQLINKTGTDGGVRSEAGLLSGSRTGVAYAVTVQFSGADLAARLRVLEAMRTFGFDLLEYVF
ncbi:serine hydrolase [Frigoribacterium sp. UYMn621]|uniref:serine hydrolase n=1 Tax=Frigoribacterium sp. UYMn621 TaxID=3156343 RepID=UPI0033924646